MANPALATILPHVAADLEKRSTPGSASDAQLREYGIWWNEKPERVTASFLVSACMRAKVPRRHLQNLSAVQRDEKWFAVYGQLLPRMGLGSTNVLLGPRGVGKTQMAIWLLADLALEDIHARRDCSLRYTNAIDLFREIRESFGKNGGEATESQVIEKYATPRLLVIDEAHDRGHSEFEAQTLNNLVDRRYGMGDRDTLFVTNQTREEFGESIGPSIISRIHESGAVIDCAGMPSFRTPR